MNKSHRVVWSDATNSWVAASELAVARRGGLSRRADVAAAILGLGAMASVPVAEAAGTPAIDLATFIAISSIVTQGGITTASDDLNAMAIGPMAHAIGKNATAIGATSAAATEGTTAVGVGAGALALNATAVGMNATTGIYATNGVSIGYTAAAEGANSIALGQFTVANGDDSVALGSRAFTAQGATGSMAFGSGAKAMAEDAFAFGTNAVAGRAHTISVGSADQTRQIVNVAAGIEDNDVVNVSQLKGIVSAIGGGAALNPDGSVAGPTYYVAGNTYNNVGDAITHMDGAITNVTNIVNGIENGAGIKYMHVNSTLDDSSADGVESVAIGGGAQAIADHSVALGANSLADRANTVSVGSAGQERQLVNVAAGSADTDAVNLGQLRQAGIDTDNSGNVTNPFVTYDDTSKTQITLGGTGASVPVAISNVKPGLVAPGSLDATNGGQLYSLADSVANALGGGSSVGSDGAVSPPVYNVAGDTYHNVGDAITHIDGDVTNVMNVVNNIQNGAGIKYFQANSTQDEAVATGSEAVAIGGNAQATADNSVALGANSTTTADLTASAYRPASGAVAGATPFGEVSVGSAGMERRVTNVAAGAADTDAVNVSQLKSVIAGSVSDAVMYDDANHESLTLGGVGSNVPVRLGNVAPGMIAPGSTDAINGGEMYNLASSVADALGGGSSVNPDGTLQEPVYNIGGNTYHNIGDVVTNIDGRVTNNTNSITNINQILNEITNTGVGIKYVHINSALDDSLATGADSVAIGGNAQATFDNSIALGANSSTDRANSVSVGSAGHERQITNVAAGTADTDAVNVAQLKQSGVIDENGNTRAAVTYDSKDGAPDYGNVTLGNGIAGGTVLHNVGAGTLDSDAVNLGQLNEALGQITNNLAGDTSPFLSVNGDASTEASAASGTHAAALGANAVANGTDAMAFGANAAAKGNGTTAVGSNSVASAPNTTALGWGSAATADGSVALGAGSVADRANSVSVGSVGAERQITNVAPGTLGTDAVNLNQLNSAVAQTNQSIHDLDSSTRKGIAAASALQIVTPYLPGRTTLNAGVAAYRGQAALGLGVSRWNEKGTINFNAGVASSGSSSTIVRAGIGIVLGD
ncbi:autotransporter adhesin [Paraburkholderia sp. GAS448]|uniref:YadA-like family protein n=1 Tax=Paraburkholderia sp. GAS448 TaxID=3035136 RepID=UPI003D24E12D